MDRNLLRTFNLTKILLPCAIVAIIFISLLTRIGWLDRIPTGISDDELHFVLNAKSIFLTGRDMSGTWVPWSLVPLPGIPMAELPAVIMAPFIGPFPLSLFFARLPYALINIFLVLILSVITWKLFSLKDALLVGFIGAVNPWNIMFGRTAYDAPLATFFYFLAFCFLLLFRGNALYFSLIPLFLGFYSYIGAKLIFLPFISLILFFSWNTFHKKRYTKQFIVLFLMCILLFSHYVVSFKNQTTMDRVSELSTPYSSTVSTEVDQERKLSIQNNFTQLLLNKYTIYTKNFIEIMLKIISPEFLFLHGEGRSTFSLWKHGYFYYIDILFLLSGVYALYTQKKSLWKFFLFLCGVSIIPTLASTVGTGFAALRSSMLFQVLIIFIGIGVRHILTSRFAKNHGIAVCFFLCFLYTLSVLNLVNIYAFRNILYNSEAYSLSASILARYSSLNAGKNNKTIIISDNPKGDYMHYLFHTSSVNTATLNSYRKNLKADQYEISNIVFTRCVDSLDLSGKFTLIGSAIRKCRTFDFTSATDALSISHLSDGAPIYRIFNDTLCSEYKLKPYPYMFELNNFTIENLPEEEFCRQFIYRSQ